MTEGLRYSQYYKLVEGKLTAVAGNDGIMVADGRWRVSRLIEETMNYSRGCDAFKVFEGDTEVSDFIYFNNKGENTMDNALEMLDKLEDKLVIARAMVDKGTLKAGKAEIQLIIDNTDKDLIKQVIVSDPLNAKTKKRFQDDLGTCLTTITKLQGIERERLNEHANRHLDKPAHHKGEKS